MLGLAATIALGAVGAQQPAPFRPTPSDTVRWAQVTYVSGASVYVSAGRDDGLQEGWQLDVIRRGLRIAILRATDLSSHRAVCTLAGPDSVRVVVGDSVRFFVRPARPAVIAVDSVSGRSMDSAATSSTMGRPALGVRGRLGLRYLLVAQRDSGSGGFNQPAAEVRIDGQRIGGTPFGVSIDARGRRTYYSSQDSIAAFSPGRTFVYSLSSSYAAPSGVRVAVGRQFSEAFANVSLYDGVSADVSRERWGTGLFAGTQPAPTTMGLSLDVKEYGAYLQAHNAANEGTLWSMMIGGIGSYHASVVNREFGFAQIVVGTPHLSLYATQEVDYNRGWKTAAGERTLQPTNTYLSAQVRPSESVTIYGGFDSRRNVRLWRDLVSPETEFDDRFRYGTWGGASLRAGPVVRLSADVRSSDGGDSTGARALAGSGSLSVGPLAGLVSAHLRTTRYRSPMLEGWLHSGAVSVSPWDGQVRIEAEGGIRDEHDAPGFAATGSVGSSRLHWFGLNTDVALGRAWYYTLTLTRGTGGWDSSDQVYTSLTWRF